MLQAAPGEEQELDDFRKELKELIVELQQVVCIKRPVCFRRSVCKRHVVCVRSAILISDRKETHFHVARARDGSSIDRQGKYRSLVSNQVEDDDDMARMRKGQVS
jgi:hypothetical protein